MNDLVHGTHPTLLGVSKNACSAFRLPEIKSLNNKTHQILRENPLSGSLKMGLQLNHSIKKGKPLCESLPYLRRWCWRRNLLMPRPMCSPYKPKPCAAT
ncbi:hypothetical protein [Alysiella crassa]|uniref:hypothetical protein n=1 Tax=Alysiella crassa TaxID=153491 RepID=UPI001FD32F5C|nr:hypothetical protein [Alysiella crassa]UOP06761.1 hypothetical protein LVJ80_13750 [Alysiella crassa]